jgi:hypothetical protein
MRDTTVAFLLAVDSLMMLVLMLTVAELVLAWVGHEHAAARDLVGVDGVGDVQRVSDVHGHVPVEPPWY